MSKQYFDKTWIRMNLIKLYFDKTNLQNESEFILNKYLQNASCNEMFKFMSVFGCQKSTQN